MANTTKDFYTVYRIYMTINGQEYSYIGATANCPEYSVTSLKNAKADTKIKNALNLFGTEAFTMEYLEYADSQEKANVYKDAFIRKYNSINRGFNANLGCKAGETPTGHKRIAQYAIMTGALVKIHPNALQAAQTLKKQGLTVSYQTIIKYCENSSKNIIDSYKGYIWKYV